MLRIFMVLGLLAAMQECSRPPPGQAWRASEERGDKPAIGYELRNDNGQVAGDAYILSPDYPHDFSHGRRAAMTVIERSPGAITFRVQWSRDLRATFRFQLKGADWPDSFQAAVTEIDGAQTYDPVTFTFSRVR
jgi:hypothetical protein